MVREATSTIEEMVDHIVGKKMMEKMGSSMNESRAAPMGHFGSKMMKKMGWKEGEGLGKNNDGMKLHIRINKREDSVGLGAD